MFIFDLSPVLSGEKKNLIGVLVTISQSSPHRLFTLHTQLPNAFRSILEGSHAPKKTHLIPIITRTIITATTKMADDETSQDPQQNFSEEYSEESSEKSSDDSTYESTEESPQGPPETPSAQQGRAPFNWIPRPMRPSERQERREFLDNILRSEGAVKRAHGALRATMETDGQDDAGGVEEHDRVEENDDLGSTWFGPPDPSYLQQWQQRQGIDPQPSPLMALFELYAQGESGIPVSGPDDQFVILGAERRRAHQIAAFSLVRGHQVFDLEEVQDENQLTLIYVHNTTAGTLLTNTSLRTGSQTTWLLLITGSTTLPEMQIIAVPSTAVTTITTTLDTEAKLLHSITVDGILHDAPSARTAAANGTRARRVVHTATNHLQLTRRFLPLTSPSLNAPQMHRWRAFVAHCSLGDVALNIVGERREVELRDLEIYDGEDDFGEEEGLAAWEAVRGRESDAPRGFGAASAAVEAAMQDGVQWVAWPQGEGDQEEAGNGEGPSGYGGQRGGQRRGADDGLGRGRGGYGGYQGRGQHSAYGTGYSRGYGRGYGNGYGRGYASGYGYVSRHGPRSDAGRGGGCGRGRGQDRERGGGSGSGSGFNLTARRAMERRR
ncbi:hypothetical protein IWX46DRAFT_660607 [Phyllosticta citricarpa]|uniref:Uncharacterized protein n=1 Tax=Phyllosticta citricarpa TaxID=55181 RepID=A0ABR1M5Q9_9PEZI